MEETYASPAVDGQTIHRRILLPEGEIRGAVLAMHGWGDHLGTQAVPFRLLTDAGYLVVGIDWPGCGQSFGKRGHLPGGVATAIRLIEETLAFLQELPMSTLENDQQCPTFEKLGLYAHSTGCFFALQYFQEKAVQPFDWVWFSSPLLRADHGQPKWKVDAANWVAKKLPSLTFDTGVRARDVRHFSTVEFAKAATHEIYRLCHHRVSAELGADLMTRSPSINDCAERLEDPTPFLLTEGTADNVCPPKFAQALIDRAPTTRKEIALLEGLRHEPFNEPDNGAFLEAARDWLARIALITYS